jgi:serine O-acetyltransferase
LWEDIVRQANAALRDDPAIEGFLSAAVLEHPSLPVALSNRLAAKLAEQAQPAESLHDIFQEVLSLDSVVAAVVRDLRAILDRDAACSGGALAAFLNYKGFLALSAYRVTHQHWLAGRKAAAQFIQTRVSEVWTLDIHPAARIGSGIFIDHGSGIVIGETAVVEDCVSLLHGVTLGGTGKHHGDRHPKVRKGVLIGAGATVLGNIEIGEGARIGAGSVVLASVPPHSTAVGVPARILAQPASMAPALDMDQSNWII